MLPLCGVPNKSTWFRDTDTRGAVSHYIDHYKSHLEPIEIKKG